MKTRLPLALSATLLLALAACDRSPPPPAPENYSEPVTDAVINTAEPLAPEPVAPEPVAIPEPVAETPPPPEPVLPDEQVMEDAEATGMTARVNRDAAEENTQPAEESEQR